MSKIKTTILVTGLLFFGGLSFASPVQSPHLKLLPAYSMPVYAAFVEEQEGFGFGGKDAGDTANAPGGAPRDAGGAPSDITGGAPADKSGGTGPNAGTKPDAAASPKGKGHTKQAGGAVKKQEPRKTQEFGKEPEQTPEQPVEEKDVSASAAAGQTNNPKTVDQREKRSEQALGNIEGMPKKRKETGAWSVPVQQSAAEEDGTIQADMTDDGMTRANAEEDDTQQDAEDGAQQLQSGDLTLIQDAADSEGEPADDPIPSDPLRRARGILLPLGCLLLGAGLLRTLLYARKK
ncbi:MAG: hypothetical protein K6E18_02165 [Lachnospiraceae bacterium]|nr:hypothetical protein [Lachnospiraceae bacterium]